MKHQIKNVFKSSENFITGFFERLPELIILIAIPVALAGYIFLRPQISSPSRAPQIITPVKQPDAAENVKDVLKTIIGDAQNNIFESTTAAVLGDKSATNSAVTKYDIPKLDLTGPWVCESNDKDGNPKRLYIQNNMVKTTFQKKVGTEHILLKDNCLYNWIGSGSGKKICEGVAEMVSIADFFTKSGMADIADVIKQMNSQSSDEMSELLSTCKKTTNIGTYIFNLPQGINWVEDNKLLENWQK
ncbi:MAG: hypothetical protein U0525_02540 [Patescibacteria group bacterium]